MLNGPVEPEHPPKLLEQTTKYLLVSIALSGPIIWFHHPDSDPDAWWFPENAWQTNMPFVLSALSSP